MRALALGFLLLCSSLVPAQTVKLPAKLSGEPGIPIPIIAEADGANVVWLTPDKGLVVMDGAFFGGDSKRAMLFGPAGSYRLWAFTAKGDKISPKAECMVFIGSVPPDPGPGPNPPDPPKPVVGLKVLIVYESGELSKYPQPQQLIMYSKAVREQLDAKCAMGADGKTKEWRIWDKDADPVNEGKFWQTSMARARKSLPWVILGNESTIAFEGPLPATSAEFLALLAKYGG